MSKRARLAGAFVALCVTALLLWWGAVDAPSPEPLRGEVPAAVGAAASIPSVGSDGAASATSLSSARGALVVAPSAPIYSADSIYATLVRLHAEKAPGSWGTLHELFVACISGSLSVSAARADLSTAAAMSGPLYSVRMEALRKLASKCETIPDFLDQHDPRADDLEGQRYQAASNALRDLKPWERPDEWERAIREVARQGKLDVVHGDILLRAYPPLKSWSGAEEGPWAIVHAAVELATAEPGREHDDIRLLERCARFSLCTFEYGALPDTLSPKDRAKAAQIVPELARIIRSGDVDALFGLKRP